MGDKSWPEPGPNWPEAKKTWGPAWEIHVYLFGGIWTIAVLYYILFFAQSILHRSDNRKSYPFIMLSFQLIIHALSRCLVLFINPYGSKSTSQVTMVVTITTWSLGTAGLISAFGVLLLILLDATKLNIAPPKFQNLVVLIAITTANFAFVLFADIVVAFNMDAKHVLLACQLVLSLWGIVTTVGYFVAATRTRRNLTATFASTQAPNKPAAQQQQLTKLRGLIMKCFASSFLGFCVFGLSVYAIIFGGSSVLSSAKYVDSWTWWAFQTTFRLLEIFMNLQIVLIALGTRSATRDDARNSSDGEDIPI